MGRCLIHSSNSADLISARESTHNHGASIPQVGRDPVRLTCTREVATGWRPFSVLVVHRGVYDSTTALMIHADDSVLVDHPSLSASC